MPMRLPDPQGKDEPIPQATDEYIENPHYGKQYLTRFEALDVINMLSSMLMADTRFRTGENDGERRRTC